MSSNGLTKGTFYCNNPKYLVAINSLTILILKFEQVHLTIVFCVDTF